MKSEIVTFPVGGAQGLPVLRLDCLHAPFDLDAARNLVAEHRAAFGVWGIWLDRVDDWTAPELREFLLDQGSGDRTVVAIRQLGDKVWPASGCEFVLDASEAIASSSNLRELAIYLNDHGGSHPAVQDLVVRLEPEALPPSANVLDMLAEFVAAQDGLNYLYLPSSYNLRELALKTLARCNSRWALR
ncbi:MAG TPA: hypothetical protein VM869_19215 [Enhygromyxa sp.]|nr:hypothetical protein [Enhygromyxa sp.]